MKQREFISQLGILACMVVLIHFGGSALAQGLITGKQIRIVIPVAAGAANDTMGRIFAEWLQKRTGQVVVVENRSGAGGNIALDQVAKSEPDGHTLLVATNGAITINPALFKKVPVDTVQDIASIAMIGQAAQLLAINADLPVRTARELIAFAKANPGSIKYGSAGLGTVPHLAMAMFSKLAGADMVHVPYRGLAPATTDLVAGNIQALTIGYGTVSSLVESGKIRIVGVASPERLTYLPDVPTAAEIGLPNWIVDTWYGLFAPRGTPKAIVDRLNALVLEMYEDPTSRKRFEDAYYGINKLNADEFAERVRSDVARWQLVVKETGIEQQ
jgi:tripartite-type tricarboxylate transporter receptor subunit TctC